MILIGSQSDLCYCCDKTRSNQLKMLKLKPYQNILPIFYILGLCPFISFNKSNTKPSILIQYFPRIILIASGLFIGYCSYNQSLTKSNAKLFYDLMTVSIYVAFFESISVWHSFRVTWQIMCFTINNMEMSLQIKCPSEIIQRKFLRKFALIMTIMLLELGVKLLVQSNNGLSLLQDTALVMTFFYKYIYLLHAIIYIDFIRLTLICLRQKAAMVKSEMDRNERLKDIRENIHVMHQIKLIHIKLWHIAQRVNEQFGWFFVTFPIDIVSTITYSVFWIFEFLVTANGFSYSTLRKSFCFPLIIYRNYTMDS